MNQRRTVLHSIIIVACLVNWACTHGEAGQEAKGRAPESVGQAEVGSGSHSWEDTCLIYPYKHRQPDQRIHRRHFSVPEPLLFYLDNAPFQIDSVLLD